MSSDKTALPADQQVAILLLSIDEEISARVLRHLADDQIDQVTRAMKQLQELAVDNDSINGIYRAAIKRLNAGGMALGDVSGHMESVLIKAFGESRGLEASERASSEILARRPFAMFESLTPEDLASLLAEEHPQIAAVFIAHLDRAKAGKVMNYIDEEDRADLIRRVANLDRTPPEVVQKVLDVMRKKVKDLGLNNLRTEPKAWIKAAAEILNNMGGGEKVILDQVSERDEAMASEIRNELFTFDDLSKIDKKSMQKVLGQVETRVLALAMKATTLSVEENVFGNLSQRASDMVREERDTLGPTPLSEVIEAQQQILGTVRDMMDKGDIVAVGGGEQLV